MFVSVAPAPASQDTLGRARTVLERWLAKKHEVAVDLSVSSDFEVGAASGTITHLHGEAFSLHYDEHNALGMWRTLVVIHAPANRPGWLLVETLGPKGLSAVRPKFVDGLVAALYLVDGPHHGDGRNERLTGLRVLRGGEMNAALWAAGDDLRRGLVFVGATDTSLDFEDFRRRMKFWTGSALGISQAYLLDPEATERFNDIVGHRSAIPVGTVRTFEIASPDDDETGDGDDPDHDPGDDTDRAVGVPRRDPDGDRPGRAARPTDRVGNRLSGRILGRARIESLSDEVLRSILTTAAQSTSSALVIPGHARTVLRRLRSEEDRVALATIFDLRADQGLSPATEGATGTEPQPAPTPSAGPGTATGTAPSAAVAAESVTATDPRPTEPGESGPAERRPDEQHVVGDDRVEAARAAQAAAQASALAKIALVQRLLDQREAELQETRAKLEETQIALEDMTLDHAVSEAARLKALDTARWLNQELAAAGAAQAWSAAPAAARTIVPDSYLDFAEAISHMQADCLWFTGDPDTVAELADRDTLGSNVQVAWECVLVMRDYLRAKRAGAFAGGMKQYLLAPPSSDFRVISPERFGERESKSDRQAYGHLRVFPLPSDEADRDAPTTATMEAHWKLPRCGMVTPRMHFLDQSATKDRIVIGYLGPHLRSRRTN